MPLITFPAIANIASSFFTHRHSSTIVSFSIILDHHVFRQNSSKFSTLSKRNNKSTESSQVEPLPVVGNFDILKDRSDKPLADTSTDNAVNIIIGSIPISVRRNNMKRTRVDLGSVQASGDNYGKSSFSSRFECNSSLTETSPTTNFTTHHEESLQRSHCGKKKAVSANIPHSSHSNMSYALADHESDSPVSFPNFEPYDICFHGKRNSPLSGSTLIDKSEESYIETQVGDIKDRILRPGMVLLKHYISHDEQVDIVKTCRNLGLGCGGFYQPGFASGAKLRLMMMCLGLDWDPQTKLYGKKRVIDGSVPPSIPYLFSKLVMRAIEDAHCLIKKECGVSYVEDILPSISPDICIVNFYTTNGKLGLHQDRDESKESLQKGLPVVSFCIGDSAEFLYGDQRDVKKAENVLLDSGDVLIFGGESRHVFHGVSSIIPDSAPNELLKDTWLRPGRLNLTFRQN